MAEKSCENCKHYAALVTPKVRDDKSVIYGYCFSSGTRSYSLNMGKGMAIFIQGGCCKKYKQDKIGRVKSQELTNADRIRSMSDEDLADFLSGIAYARATPWSEAFVKEFCESCPDPEYTLDDGRRLRLHECDLADGKCPHGPDVLWWLRQPEEDQHA